MLRANKHFFTGKGKKKKKKPNGHKKIDEQTRPIHRTNRRTRCPNFIFHNPTMWQTIRVLFHSFSFGSNRRHTLCRHSALFELYEALNSVAKVDDPHARVVVQSVVLVVWGLSNSDIALGGWKRTSCPEAKAACQWRWRVGGSIKEMMA